jgi:uncharacterized membrane protein YphA (DoxX/SURF4 family)
MVPHVRFVTDENPAVAAVEFFLAVVGDPLNAALLATGAIAAAVTAAGYLRVQPFERDREALRAALADYWRFVPWLLRLSLGLPLIGAGFAGYLFNPAVPASGRLVQVGLGFLLLFGLGTRAVALAGLGLYLLAAAVYPSALLSAEYAGGFVAIALLGSGRPSADDLLQRVAEAGGAFGRVDPVHRAAAQLNRTLGPAERYAPVAVRAGLGFVFVVLGFWEKLAHPGQALAVVEKYGLVGLVPVDPGLWVVGAALVEIALGVLLITGLFTRAAAGTGFLVLTTTLFGLPDDPVLVHVTLFGFVSALFVTGAGPLSLDARIRAVGTDPDAGPEGAPGASDSGAGGP